MNKTLQDQKAGPKPSREWTALLQSGAMPGISLFEKCMIIIIEIWTTSASSWLMDAHGLFPLPMQKAPGIQSKVVP